MSDNSSEDEAWVPYEQRDEWQDITPVAQNDGEQAVCAIAYDERYLSTLNYFRAVLQKREVSERAWGVTTETIELNPAHYTAWVYRLELFRELGKSGEAEIEWLNGLAKDHPKNYQLWHYRESIVKSLLLVVKDDGEGEDGKKRVLKSEMGFSAEMIDEDSKNFHVWSYRQWLVSTFAAWEEELEFIESEIEKDVRNNSAWNQRYFVVVKGGTNRLPDEVIEREIRYAVEKIKLAPSNESPWTYIYGLLKRYAPEQITTTLFDAVAALVKASYSDEEPQDIVPGLMGKSAQYYRFLIDAYEMMINDQRLRLADGEGVDELLQKAIDCCDRLAVTIDPIRNAYWLYRKQTFLSSD
ncbi:CAAX geranylgeranyltransferase alpha subunit [Spiromyces aspiralis]|uniref:CAAX geranylgeranyltransferase alpha subunit n=1 Tax=Spiromyces aspiralis TaxID=68401 RepID=A0ACC1HJL9_9FUNG|nr:CAAX geranylgeranyltransferase alpha subunit [Spiromyces aspiralis]